MNEVPSSIKLHRQTQVLELVYKNGSKVSLAAEYLRVFSPSAELRGHAGDKHKFPAGKARVAITHVEPQGNYGIKLHFSDSHRTGIFTWQYLMQLGNKHEHNWQRYLSELKAENKTREPGTEAVKLIDPK